MTRKGILKRFKEIEVINKGKVTFRSGIKADFYCDIKKSFGYPDIMNDLAKEICKKIPKEVTCIAASGYGGLPIGALVAVKSNKNFIAIRGSEKKYGKGGMIDGYQPNEKDLICIIDDVLTTGSSIKETLGVLNKTKAKIYSAIVIVKRGEAKLKIPYEYLFFVDELL